jgi:2-polyprenyl-6-hydroxyphenyl methylase/3-demethylubiquinone-9 3-methyltransferase
MPVFFSRDHRQRRPRDIRSVFAADHPIKERMMRTVQEQNRWSSSATGQPDRSEKITFSFGRNWQDFVKRYLNPERESVAIASLLEFLERKDLKDLSFLDIGCGSGLFSLAAYRLGAKRIVSVDVDPFSVECTTRLRQAVGSPENWSVLHGSILDRSCVAKLESADIVYAWGSLHHTGAMWEAIRNASKLVAPNGLFYLAIYNKVEGRSSSDFWLKVKKLYNRASTPTKRLMELLYVVRYQALPELIRLRNPFSFWRNYSKGRGMNAWIDVRDWLGGYPYEFANAGEIFRFCRRELGLTLVNLHSVNNLGLNEFLFRRT